MGRPGHIAPHEVSGHCIVCDPPSRPWAIAASNAIHQAIHRGDDVPTEVLAKLHQAKALVDEALAEMPSPLRG